ncbi:MAG: enoyl-CoA hydratase/isomerase family protein [Desulfobacteraceae bacterium]|nr:enoyl-CoA hydratase/isomerase family protein [Desulfobacteraceae bacterium]
MNYQTITVEKKGQVGFLFLNRPEVLNSLSEQMGNELLHFMTHAIADNDLRVLILSGKGRAFSAGADLNMFKARYQAFRETGQSQNAARAELPKAFINFPKPIIAVINGPAVGFGATLPLICDLRLASDQAKISFAFVRVGVTPEFCSSYFLPRLVGYGKAAELVFTAKMILPPEALEIGLVNRVIPHDRLMEEAEALAQQIAQMPAGAIRAAKAVLRHGSHSTIEQVVAYESLVFQTATQSQEHYDAVCRIMEELKEKKK